jgi:signal transduction histidine kinase
MMTTIENISISGFYESIIENAESNILILDQHFMIVSLNPGFYWIFLEMYDIQLKKGDKLFDILRPIAPQVSDRWRARCTSAMKGLSISDEEEFESHGQHFYWKIYYKAVELGNDRFLSIYSRNISVNKLFQNKILKHEANLRTIINSFNASIWLLNERYELIDFNDQAINHFLSLYNETLLPSKNFIELLPGSIHGLRERWFDRLNVAALTCEPASYLDQLSLSSGEVICETRIIPILSDNGVIGHTISVEDMTKKSNEEQLQKAQMNELMKINTELDKFVYSASHDLRAPLLSIMGVIDLMKRESGQDPLYLNHIESSVKKLDTFVTNIINYSRNNKVEVSRDEIDFHALIDSVIDHLKYLEGGRVVKCSRQINQEASMFTDADRLTVVFHNLIANVFQHYDKWKESTCSIHVHVNREVASVRISDNGVGIRPDFLDRVFEMFFRASERSNGSGLGLYVVRQTIDKLHGTVGISSTLGTGTEVVIEIPNLLEQLPSQRLC